jgi:hypothetical protein
MTGSSSAAIERKAIWDQLRAKSLDPETISNQRMRFFEALTHTNATEFDQDYVFGLLVAHVLPSLSQLNGLTRTVFRKALCHLDLAWYKAKPLSPKQEGCMFIRRIPARRGR